MINLIFIGLFIVVMTAGYVVFRHRPGDKPGPFTSDPKK